MAEVIASSPAGLTQQTTSTNAHTTTTSTIPHARWPSLPTNLLSLLNPFAQTADSDDSHNINKNDPTKATLESQHPTASSLKRPVLSTVQFGQSGSAPPSPSRSSASIMFAEPETRSTSEDGSREGSISDLKRSRKSSRPKERMSICHPVPESKVKQRLHRQPRSLLQLHRLQPNARPLPALEVIPSANFSVRLTRAITKVFQAKHGFCANDLVVLKAEKYGTQDEEAQARDVIGLICKGSREEQKIGSGKMLIHMASGKQWEAYTTANGAYECCTTDEHGLKETVRWVPKKNKDGKGISSDGTRKFNFSTISPHSRRHPIIANLQKTALDINDSYKVPEPLAVTPLGTPSMSATILEDGFDEEVVGRNECTTDDATRQIIYLTAIWVAMREGWSPNFRYEDKRESLIGESPNSPARSMTNPPHSPPASPSPYASLEKRASIKSFGSGIVRRASVMSRSKRNSTASVKGESDAESPAPSRSASVTLGPSGRSRADSSATVLVHRAASNRRKKTEAMASFRSDLVCDDDLHEMSNEDLSTRPSVDTPKKPRPSPLARKAGGHPSGHGERSADTTPDGVRTAGKSRSLSLTPEDKPGHRTSTTTDGTTSTRQPSHQPQSNHHPLPQFQPEKKRKKGGVWRKLLCGASKSI
ncbi:hypothetical protein Slin15195_G059100 [Septoria linicola]|uniref:Uncharacterized protein n=1 Tax=Septoria linicola TaxID=215465 RepID=A0A9Q9EIA0_9PEZI|nr:hypothetical protein Slin14017_G074960 [Septoria linicola]USW52591.1 hypothetical protein Slin15195_G059100 [Septoria linicola]